MDGTGRLFASCVRQLAPELGPRVVSYPLQNALGYAGLIQEIPIPHGPFAIVAESFSGPLGIRLATQHRERVRALVLVATFVRNPSPLLLMLGTLLAPLLFRRPPPAFAIRWALLGKDATAPEIAELRAVLRTVPREVLAAGPRS